MATYPVTRKAYPVTPKAYPATPKAYPGTGVSSFPISAPTLGGDTVFNVDIVASVLSPLLADTVFTVSIVASEATLATAQLDINPAKNVTLSTTMRVTGGATPPVVLLAAGTGSLTFATNCPGFWVDILAGALTFDLSFDSGATVTFAAQTIPVGGGNYTIPSGTYSGMIITFPLGTYDAASVYEGAVESITTSDTGAYVFNNTSVASQPVYRVASGSEGPYLFCAGAQRLSSTAAGVLALFTNDPAYTLISRIAYTASDAAGAYFTIAQTGGTNGKRRWEQTNAGTGREASTFTNDAGASTVTQRATDGVGTSPHNIAWYAPGSNGGLSCSVDNGAADPSASACNPGTLTPGRASIGCCHDNSPDTFLSGKIYRILAFSSNLSAGDRTAWHDELTP